jgi:hypothetical protein
MHGRGLQLVYTRVISEITHTIFCLHPCLFFDISLQSFNIDPLLLNDPSPNVWEALLFHPGHHLCLSVKWLRQKALPMTATHRLFQLWE